MIASGSQSSMWSNTRSSSQSRASGVPQWCGCGCYPVLRWSTTEANPNKPFFGCPNYNINGVGTNFRKLASLKDVAELAPCSGSIVTDPDGGVEDLLLVCNLDGLAGQSQSPGHQLVQVLEQGLLEQLKKVLLEDPE
ncbi:hypothetical protein Ahy_A04g018182 [Arachis hypogaea]|uniref:Zinc finger GRF-type domain-containing protein n=1 Tax=Arachis hypogaea TaxID=3818 RepID=A0A445DD19_ARAHY|nr:hypothetical protein Ahy_A04g018182 [Arachis hypogaea]